MKSLHLEEIRQIVHGVCVSEPPVVHGHAPPGVIVTGVTNDTRACKAGDLYFAICGERFDGHAFLAHAAQAGCVAAVVTRGAELPEGAHKLFAGGLIVVDSTTRALGDLAAGHRKMVPATVIAVTGSNGKTTTKRLVQHILSKRLKGTCSPKSFNNEIGVPLTLLDVAVGDDYVICEVGTSAPGEIATLAAICRPDIAVITSVGETHLERLGSVEKVAIEKTALLEYLSPGGFAAVWADSPLLDKALKAHAGARTLRFGTSDSAELRITGYEPTPRGQRFQLNGHLWVELPMPGRHNASNATAAIAVAQRMGFDAADAAAALADFGGTHMRLETAQVGSLRLINDAYNANPASMMAAADVLADVTGCRRVMIAADMRELGEQSQALHERTGRDIARRGIDLLIGVGAMGRYIAQGAREGGIATEWFDSVDQAAARLPEVLRPGDTVLLKGSRAMAMERLIAPLTEAFAAPADDKGSLR